MSPKAGILHDYDLMANNESSASNQTCVICNASPMSFQWSDYSGEAMCRTCGCPYQLKWGSKKQQKEGKYPYQNIQEEWIPIIKDYWEKTKSFVCHGTMMGEAPGAHNFYVWVKENHPDMIKREG